MTEDDMKYRQGRSKKQYSSSSVGAMISFIGLAVMALLFLILKLIN